MVEIAIRVAAILHRQRVGFDMASDWASELSLEFKFQLGFLSLLPSFLIDRIRKHLVLLTMQMNAEGWVANSC